MTNPNPFHFGGIVQGRDYCHRPELEGSLASMVDACQNIALIGERRQGKSSLVVEVSKKTKERTLLYVDFLAAHSAGNLANRIAVASLKCGSVAEKFFKSLKAGISFSFDSLTNTPSFKLEPSWKSHDGDPAADLLGALDCLEKLNKKTPLLVVFDEFQDILKIPNADEVIAALRGKIQFHSKIPYIFTGSVRNEMDKLFNDESSPLYKSAAIVWIDELKADRFSAFLTRKFKKGNRTVDPSLYPSIEALGITVPGDIQQICSALWNQSNPGDHLSEESLQNAIQQVIELERPRFEEMIQSLTPNGLKCLIGIAYLGGEHVYSREFLDLSAFPNSTTLTRALNTLVKLRHLVKIGKAYHLSKPFFGIWLKATMLPR